MNEETKTNVQSSSLLQQIRDFLAAPLRVQTLEAEKNNLEAFLSAFPGEYCGLASDGHSIYSPGFASILGISNINSLVDIQNALDPGDSAALEGFIDRLRTNKTPFTLQACSLNGARHFKISGGLGGDQAGSSRFVILWVEDITNEVNARISEDVRQHKKTEELEQIRAALNAVPRPIWLRDHSQKITWVNKTYCEYLGKTASEIVQDQLPIASGAAKRKKGEDEDKDRDLARDALNNGAEQEEKLHAIFHGKRLLLRLSEVPIPARKMTLGMAYNITREEELEQEMTRFQTSSRELMEQLRSAIAIFDANQQLIFYNAAYTQLWELEANWLNRQPKLGDIMEKLRENRRLPEQADFRAFKKSWLDMFTNLLQPREDMLYLPDGIILRMLIVPHSLGGLMMTFEDVTSRLALESSYNTLIAVQKETLDNLAEAVSVFGGDGRLKLFNPSYARMWKITPDMLTGEPHINSLIDQKKAFFTDSGWADSKRILLARALGHDLSAARLTCLSHDDDPHAPPRLIDISAVSLPDGGVLVTYSDVTSTVAVENALRDKAQALEAAEQLKLDFLANVSYQLRTPLSSIMGFSDILSHEYFGALNERQKEYTDDIRTASERLLGLINNILDLSTLEAGFMTLERSDIIIDELFSRIEDLVHQWARKEDIQLIVECPDDLQPLNADGKRLQQAIINLIRNAIAFTPAHGTITLRAEQDKKAMHISVIDTGAGISALDTKRIFEPFERAKEGAQARGLSRSGAGIGLSLVRRIVEAHHGHVDLQSEEGKGTTVTLSIPLSSTKTTLKIPAAKKSG